MELLDDIDKYNTLTVYKDDTIKYIKELHCYAKSDQPTTNIKTIIEIR